MKKVSIFFYDITGLNINTTNPEELSRFISNLKELTKIHDTEKMILSLVSSEEKISELLILENALKKYLADKSLIDLRRHFTGKGYLENRKIYNTRQNNNTEIICYSTQLEHIYMLSGIYYASTSLDNHDSLHYKAKFYLRDDGISSIILDHNTTLTEINEILEEKISNHNKTQHTSHSHTLKPQK